jgi:hypothetical protein
LVSDRSDQGTDCQQFRRASGQRAEFLDRTRADT